MGDVYIVDEENFRVQKFDASGHFVLMLGAGVNKTTGGDVCTVASGDTCGAGTQGRGEGAFKDWDAGSFVAVGRGGILYVGDKGRIQEFTPDGRYRSEIDVPRDQNVGSIAIDRATGAIYYSYSQFWTDDPRVYKLSEKGHPICSVSVGAPTALSVAEKGDVYAVVERSGQAPFEIAHLDSQCELVSNFGRVLTGTNLNSLAVVPDGRLYVGAFVFEAPRSYLSVYEFPSEGVFHQLMSAIHVLREVIGKIAAQALVDGPAQDGIRSGR